MDFRGLSPEQVTSLNEAESKCAFGRTLRSSLDESSISCDYLILGAGSMGLGFTDALVAQAKNISVVIVDDRVAPSGHWNDAYYFAHGYWYGCSSLSPAPCNSHETGQPHQGLPDGYCVATTRCAQQFFENQLRNILETGQVRYFPSCRLEKENGAYVAKNVFTGQTWEIEVQKKFVDCTFSKVEIPVNRPPPFQVDDGVSFHPPHGLGRIHESPSGFVVIGAGRTGIDTVCWMIDHGISPSRIKWVMPSNAFIYVTPVRHKHYGHLGCLDLWAHNFGVAVQDAASKGEDGMDVMRKLKDRPPYGHRLVALDQYDAEDPEIYRCVSSSEKEMATIQLLPKENIIRMGYVRHIQKNRIVFEEGTIETTEGTLHVDCSARGQLGHPPIPIWDADKKTITPQPVVFCNQAISSSILGHIEALFANDDDYKNQIAKPVPPTHSIASVLKAFQQQHENVLMWSKEQDIRKFLLSQMIFVDTPERRAELEEEGTLGAMQTLLTTEDLTAVLKAEATRMVDIKKHGKAPKALRVFYTQ